MIKSKIPDFIPMCIQIEDPLPPLSPRSFPKKFSDPSSPVTPDPDPIPDLYPQTYPSVSRIPIHSVSPISLPVSLSVCLLILYLSTAIISPANGILPSTHTQIYCSSRCDCSQNGKKCVPFTILYCTKFDRIYNFPTCILYTDG